MSAGRVVLVRHGPTEWSVAHRHTGRTDLPLTEEGRRVAATLRERLASWRFSTVLCSPLRRAVETAELAGLAGAARMRDDLMEWDYGAYEGRTGEDVRVEVPGWTVWEHGAPGGEAPQDVERRVDRALGEVLEARTRGDVAVVAHGHLLRAFGARWIDQPVAFGERLLLGTAAICVLGEKRGARVVERWNDEPA